MGGKCEIFNINSCIWINLKKEYRVKYNHGSISLKLKEIEEEKVQIQNKTIKENHLNVN